MESTIRRRAYCYLCDKDTQVARRQIRFNGKLEYHMVCRECKEIKLMGKDHEGDIKQYVLLSEAWYAKSRLGNADYTDDVNFGFYSPDGGTSGEMSVKWYRLQDNKPPSPKLECFSDAWHTLAQFKDVIDAMAEVDGQDITPKEFCQLLGRCGFVDATPRKYEDSYPSRRFIPIAWGFDEDGAPEDE